MKFSSLLLIIATFQSFALTYSQEAKFNISAQDKTMLEVLRMIEKQSDYRFFFSDNYQELFSIVSLDARNESLTEVLRNLLSDKAISYKLLENNIIVIAPSKALQQKKVSGTITDSETGEPLPGVNITIEGTTLGTTSNQDGTYSIEIPQENVTLTFSFVGYLSEKMIVQNQTVIDMKMAPEIKSLEEVVVV
ncbi:MAG TPA: carboxypeptidase-like regulatory domain-containing protein, partial [Bacteroidales bacterium]|nr:carboxypeptidase-like regulatory domain-containing protein [Bacteroidales bacterium]